MLRRSAMKAAFAPDLADAGEVFRYLGKAVEKAGYTVGKDVVYAMDAAASELYNEETGMYHFPGENGICRDAEEMIALYEDLAKRFPLVSIEDGLQEDDWEGWQSLTGRLGDGMQLVGDDLFVTNPKRIKCGIKLKCGKCGADKGESDRHADGGVGRHRDGTVCRLSHGDLPPFRGDGGCVYRGSCGRGECGAD